MSQRSGKKTSKKISSVIAAVVVIVLYLWQNYGGDQAENASSTSHQPNISTGTSQSEKTAGNQTSPQEPIEITGVWQGVPSSNSDVKVWQNPGFVVGYSESRKNPLWVMYKLEYIKNRRIGPRPDHFNADPRSSAGVEYYDFSRSGYDRGHMAPNYDIGSQYGREAQLATFLMSNISPQKSNLNKKLWQRLEEAIISHFLDTEQTLWVVAGPVFDKNIEKLRSGVEVPDAFYKIIVKPSPVKPEAMAFVMPQNVRGSEPLSNYLVSIDEVESLTGLDFFQWLSDNTENALEASTASVSQWRLKQIDTKPPRY